MAQPVRKLPKGSSPARESEAPQEKSAVREYGEAIIIAIILAIVIRTFFFQAYKIPSGSMEPTLKVGDHIIVNKLIYGFRLPDSFFGFTPFAHEIPYGHYLFHLEPVHRGDVVVFVFPLDPTKDFIKRVIGVPGDTVQIIDGRLFLNGKKAKDPHAHFTLPNQDRSKSSPRDYYGPIKIPPGKYFMMGDNRDESWDSRFWGLASRHRIEGRAMFIYWSCRDDNSLIGCVTHIRWNRFFKVIR